jgi:menaquinone-dependent protoporphyrinogen IX oxidase
MKHLKKFEQHNDILVQMPKKYVLIENSSTELKPKPNFVFVVNQKNNTIQEKKYGVNEIKKYVDLPAWKEEFLISGCGTVYSWQISLYYDIDNTNYIRISGISYGNAVIVN